jgi:3-hydroxyisobutyrate dehydrogenase-like beta-hydroxyacid dehydrogenase
MQNVMSTTGANSGALRQSVLAKAVPRDFEPGFRLALLHKDHGLASQMARRVGAPLTITNTIQELRTVALDRGLGDFDSSVFVKLFEELAGVELR